MEKNDKFYNISIFLIGLLYLGEGLMVVLNPKPFNHNFHSISPDVANTIAITLGVVVGLIYGLVCVGIFMHKEWGRKAGLILLYFCGILMFIKIISFVMKGLAPSLYSEGKLALLIVLPIYFLTHPKVKELFN